MAAGAERAPGRGWARRDDQELIADICQESTQAFSELYDRYCHRAYRVAVAVCRDDGQAQDAMQEAFLSLWRNPAVYQPQRGSVAGWLLSSVHHRAIDVYRRNARHSTRRANDDQLEAVAGSVDVADELIQREEVDRLRAALAQLPDAQQEVIALAYYGELSHTEIAAALDLPAGTVKGRMRLGLTKLRSSVERRVA